MIKETLEKIEQISEKTLSAIKESVDLDAINDVRVKILGKKGELTAVLKTMGKLSADERPVIGAKANEVREAVERAISEQTAKLKSLHYEARIKSEAIDVTLPGKRMRSGRPHPMSIVLNDLKEIFRSMGYTVVAGPEIEETRYVFDMLNTFEGHPARDESDTFYISDDVVLRTQTSSVQIRTMLENKPPIAIISPGRVFRRDEFDATHSPVFNQCEALVVDKNITFADLKGTLETFMKRLYGDSVKLRFRPHNFPYTEPSAEVDLSCFKCNGQTPDSGYCGFCKNEGWVEMLGAGVVHPQVLRNCGIDPDVYSGFAFGMGLERITMMRYEIDDLRHLYENDIRFLKQF
ncbi:MAG: phenylalanine--tRNA ligase subunit alpha [Oscillospiraceae bacterium]|jgi:phenylalanyl-tRNA synthetase alpha chain|nr:phenylalanine--tRNA ligase subunit alpha [Oscillospiraceae bacterium]